MKRFGKLSIWLLTALITVEYSVAAGEPFSDEAPVLVAEPLFNEELSTGTPPPPPDGDCPDCFDVPLDDHLGWLVLAGVAFGVWRIRRNNAVVQ